MPARPLLIFDGDCAFCTSCAAWAARRVHHDAQPWQRADLEALGLTVAQAQASIWLIVGDVRVSGSDAAAQLLTRAHSFRWRLVGELMSLPGARAIARPLYRLVARNRHRLPGATPACELSAAQR